MRRGGPCRRRARQEWRAPRRQSIYGYGAGTGSALFVLLQIALAIAMRPIWAVRAFREVAPSLTLCNAEGTLGRRGGFRPDRRAIRRARAALPGSTRPPVRQVRAAFGSQRAAPPRQSPECPERRPRESACARRTPASA